MSDKHTYSLFDESEYQPSSEAESGSLVIRAQPGRELSKEQRSFNKLVKRIAQLEGDIAAERDKLEGYLRRYAQKVAPLEGTLAQCQIAFARILAAANGRLALGKRQVGTLRSMILDLCGEAFRSVQPDAETEMFYDEWAETTYREEARQQAEGIKDDMAQDLRDRFGIDLDAFEEDASPEGMARFMNRVKDRIRTAEEENARSQHGRSNSKRERQREKLQQREALTKSSVRGIYLSLAKVLHPDAVSDASERALREDFMKQASLAYQQGDIGTLLRLELRWASRSDAAEGPTTDESLRAYLPALKEQVAQLEQSLRAQALAPRYRPIRPIAVLAERPALAELNKRAQALRMATAEIERDRQFVKSCTSKTALVGLARDYLDAREAEWDLDEVLAAIRRT